MLRLVLFELFAFTIPFLVYGLYVMVFNKKEAGANFWQQMPLFNLCMAGLLLVGGGIIGYGLYWS